MKPHEVVVITVVVICVTIVIFTWLTRSTLCSVTIRQGNTEVAAQLACEARR